MKRREFVRTSLVAVFGVSVAGLTAANEVRDIMVSGDKARVMEASYDRLWQHMNYTLQAKRIKLDDIKSAYFAQERNTFRIIETGKLVDGVDYRLVVRTKGAPSTKGAPGITYGLSSIWLDGTPPDKYIQNLSNRDRDHHPVEAYMRHVFEKTGNSIVWMRYTA